MARRNAENNGRKWDRWWATVLLMAVGMAVGVAGGFATARTQIAAHSARLNGLEERQRDDHDCLTRLDKDIAWIRETLARMEARQRNGRGP